MCYLNQDVEDVWVGHFVFSKLLDVERCYFHGGCSGRNGGKRHWFCLNTLSHAWHFCACMKQQQQQKKTSSHRICVRTASRKQQPATSQKARRLLSYLCLRPGVTGYDSGPARRRLVVGFRSNDRSASQLNKRNKTIKCECDEVRQQKKKN